MKELISREDLRDRMYHEAFEVDSEMQKWDSGCWIRYKLFEKILYEMPTIKKALEITKYIPRPQGEWIEIKYRKPTEEEKEIYPEAEEWFDCELPEHGEEVLVTTAYNNSIAMTTFANYGDEGCGFEDYDAEEIIAWCRLPEPYIAGREVKHE